MIEKISLGRLSATQRHEQLEMHLFFDVRPQASSTTARHDKATTEKTISLSLIISDRSNFGIIMLN
jgi:hypothetical protein